MKNDTPAPGADIRVAVIEDDDRVRESLAVLIDGTAGFCCANAYGSGEEALKSISSKLVDVVLIDINLGRMTGIDCLRKLKLLEEPPLLVMLTAYEDDDLVFQALKSGANGYLIKQTSPADLLAAIKEVHGGGAPMSSSIARKVIESFHGRFSFPAETLSNREREILSYLAKGYQYKEIASALDISFETVHSHIRKIYHKLHVRSRGEAVNKYRGL
jgi:DNA-binding NarL/FixJ family response regulator